MILGRKQGMDFTVHLSATRTDQTIRRRGRCKLVIHGAQQITASSSVYDGALTIVAETVMGSVFSYHEENFLAGEKPLAGITTMH